MKKKLTAKRIIDQISNCWSNIDSWINTECDHHHGRWSADEKRELNDAIARRDAYQNLLEKFGYFKS